MATNQPINLSENALAQLSYIGQQFLPAVVTDVLMKAATPAAMVLEEGISEYPEQTGNALPLFYTLTRDDGTTYKSKFKSVKQRKKVMALARGGKDKDGNEIAASIPYKRTGTLGKSITTETKKAGKGKVRIRIGSDRDYAPYVIGDDSQMSHYHKGNWTPLVDDVDAAIPAAVQAFETSLTKQLDNLLKTSSAG